MVAILEFLFSFISELLLNLDLNPLQFHLPRPPTTSASAVPLGNSKPKTSQDGHKALGKKDSHLPSKSV